MIQLKFLSEKESFYTFFDLFISANQNAIGIRIGITIITDKHNFYEMVNTNRPPESISIYLLDQIQPGV